jgi:F0F1-type ATP synthase assembly protein I
MSVKDSSVRGRSTIRGSSKKADTRPKAIDRTNRDAEADGRALGLGTGWTIFSYLIGGMAAYGGIGWLVGRWVHIAMLFPIGMLVGLAISLGYIIYRYGRQDAVARKETTGDR